MDAGRDRELREIASSLDDRALAQRMRDDAIDVAVDLADPAKLAATGRGMRERLRSSPLLDARGLAAALEAAYRAMWRRCVGRSTPGAARP